MKRYNAPKPTPENIYEFTDSYGDMFALVPTGDGGIQFEITQPDGLTYEVRVPASLAASELMRMFRFAVDATGRTPEEIKREFRSVHGLPPERVSVPGSSFGKPVKP